MGRVALHRDHWIDQDEKIGAAAEPIDRVRRESLIASRDSLAELEQWEDASRSRQAIPFLRVFGSDETLDGTLVHPDDYPLAKKLAKSLEIELPPEAPPGYQSPQFEEQPNSRKHR